MRRSLSAIIIVVLGIVTAIAWLPSRMHFPFDDTYITFRYAEHLAHGLGIVWNPGGPHTEGYTNFLYVLLLAPFSWIGADLLQVSQALNVVAVIVTGLAIARLVQQLQYGHESAKANYLPYFAVALFYFDPYTWFNAYSGMETSLFTMWVVLAIAAAAKQLVKRSSVGILPFLFATLATLTRPEGAMLGGILLVAGILWARSSNAEVTYRPVARAFMLGFVLPIAIYAAWKLWYFGGLLPNSFYVKVAQPNPNHTIMPGRGALVTYVLGAWYLIVPAAYLVWSLIRGRTEGVRLDIIVFVAAAWVACLGAFYLFSQLMMPNYYRFYNSIETILIVLATVGLYRLFGRLAGQRSASRRVAMVTVALCAFAILHVIVTLYFRYGAMWMTSDTTYEQREMEVASLLRSIPDHTAITVASADAGIIPYFSGVQHMDVVGLNTTAIARAPSTDAVLDVLEHRHPDIYLIPVEVERAPTAKNKPDSCREIVRWGHGLIGLNGYPRLASRAVANGYVSVGAISEVVYDFNVMVDGKSPHFADIRSAFQNQRGNNSIVGPPIDCMR